MSNRKINTYFNIKFYIKLQFKKLSLSSNFPWYLYITHIFLSLPSYVETACDFVCYLLSHVWLFATKWSVALHTSLFIGFCRQEYQSGFPFSSPEDLLNPGIEPRSPALQIVSLPYEPPGKPTCDFRDLNFFLNTLSH